MKYEQLIEEKDKQLRESQEETAALTKKVDELMVESRAFFNK